YFCGVLPRKSLPHVCSLPWGYFFEVNADNKSPRRYNRLPPIATLFTLPDFSHRQSVTIEHLKRSAASWGVSNFSRSFFGVSLISSAAAFAVSGIEFRTASSTKWWR